MSILEDEHQQRLDHIKTLINDENGLKELIDKIVSDFSEFNNDKIIYLEKIKNGELFPTKNMPGWALLFLDTYNDMYDYRILLFCDRKFKNSTEEIVHKTNYRNSFCGYILDLLNA
jgi:hypothetical protein